MMIIKEEKKYKNSPLYLVILSLASFCFSGWYYSRGSTLLIGYNLPIWFHETLAFIMGGVFPAIIFEVVLYLLTIKSRMVRVHSGAYDARSHLSYVAPPREVLDAIMLSERKKISTLRVFIIMANITCFGLSFIYFYNRMLYVYGRILLNFVVSLLFFIAFLFYQLPKTEKNKKAFTLAQTGRIFLMVYCIISAIEIVFNITG